MGRTMGPRFCSPIGWADTTNSCWVSKVMIVSLPAPFPFALLGLCLLTPFRPLLGAESWIVRVEEPTGLYPRSGEVVAVPYAKIGGPQPAWRVLDAGGNELPWQATDAALLFPASLIPGELPEYRIAAAPASVQANFTNRIHPRKIGLNRVELGNRFFRVLLNTQAPAIIEACNLRAEEYRKLNLVETTPEDAASLKDDIHAAQAMGIQPVPGVPDGNVGWTSLGGGGSFTNIEVAESGPVPGQRWPTPDN